MKNLKRGFFRLAAVLSIGGLIVGLLALRYSYVRGEWLVTHEFGSWVAYLILLALWPWIAFFAIRWIVQGFRSS